MIGLCVKSTALILYEKGLILPGWPVNLRLRGREALGSNPAVGSFFLSTIQKLLEITSRLGSKHARAICLSSLFQNEHPPTK